MAPLRPESCSRNRVLAAISIRETLTRIIRRIIAALVLLAIVVTILWNLRTDLSASSIPLAEPARDGAVTATWLGATTILFDDGQTQLLIDSYLTRPTLVDLLLGRPIQSDAATVNAVLYEQSVTRLAAIITTHTHFDHALDLGAVANRTEAIVLGSPSAARIARGAGVPETQISIVTDAAIREFGEFSVRLVPSAHSAFGWRGSVPLAGPIETPLRTPAPAQAFRAGNSFSIVVSHPAGTSIVQSTTGETNGALSDVDADVVFLGTAMLSGFGRPYAQRYWNELVTSTGATRVFPIHFDDYTKSPKAPESFPKVLDNFARTERWLREFQNFWDPGTRIEFPVYGQAIDLYGTTNDDSRT